MRRYLSVLMATVLLVSLVGVTSIGNEEKPVSIGVLLPLTGTQAVMAEDLQEGFLIAQEQINAAGGVLGRPLELIIEDTETRPAPGMDAARKLVELDNVPVIAGGFSSGVALPIAKYLQEQGIVGVFQPPTSPLFRGVGDYIFLINVLDNYKGKVIAEFAVEDSGLKKFALMFMNNAFGQALKEETIKNLEKLGAEVVTVVDYELNKVDYKAELTRLYADDPEAIIATFYANEGFVAAKQAYEMGLLNVNEVQWYCPEMASSFAKAATEIPEVVEGIKGLNPLPPESLFMKVFKEKKGRNPITAYSAMNYDALIMIAMAMNFAQSTDPAAIRDALPKIDQWYRGQSTGGDKRFDEDGMQGFGQYAKLILRDGEEVPYPEG